MLLRILKGYQAMLVTMLLVLKRLLVVATDLLARETISKCPLLSALLLYNGLAKLYTYICTYNYTAIQEYVIIKCSFYKHGSSQNCCSG